MKLKFETCIIGLTFLLLALILIFPAPFYKISMTKAIHLVEDSFNQRYDNVTQFQINHIRFDKPGSHDNINKKVWILGVTGKGWRDDVFSGEAITYFVDPNTGQINSGAIIKFQISETPQSLEQDSEANKTDLILEPEQVVSVETWTINDLLDPEKALSHGFKGYVNVSYISKVPVRIIVSPSKIVNYTIQLELIPHVPEFTETEVLLDPESASGFGVGWGDPVPIFNNYIRYSPNGLIFLRVDEPRNVTMVLSVPEGFNGMSAYPRHLLRVGIMADIPVASASGAGLDRIPRDEG